MILWSGGIGTTQNFMPNIVSLQMVVGSSNENSKRKYIFCHRHSCFYIKVEQNMKGLKDQVYVHNNEQFISKLLELKRIFRHQHSCSYILRCLKDQFYVHNNEQFLSKLLELKRSLIFTVQVKNMIKFLYDFIC